MKCINCQSNKILKPKKLKAHRYTESGLDNVVLRGVDHYRCEECGEEYYGYGDVERLHQAIANILIQKPTVLSGAEFRFLRKLIGYSTGAFASRVGITQETISRYETGGRPIPTDKDVMLRALVAAMIRDRDYDAHDAILERKGRAFDVIELKRRDDGWSAKAA